MPLDIPKLDASGGGRGRFPPYLAGGGRRDDYPDMGRLDALERRTDRIEQKLDLIISRLGEFATKRDLVGYMVGGIAVSISAVGIVVGGIIGGLAWIKPDAPPMPAAVVTPAAAPAPVINLPAPQVIIIPPYGQLPAQPGR